MASVTIRDVARESGVSAATVSIVLNDAPLAQYILPQTRERILKSAKKLGYRPNMVARSLRSKRNHTVGVMVFDLTDPFCTLILRGIENALYQSSYVPILTDAHNDRARFERYLEMMLDRRVEGLIVIANWLFVDVELLSDLEKRRVPTAMIGRELKGKTISSVMVDNQEGASLALEHLFKLGHRKIAFIRGPKSLVDTPYRSAGIKNCAQSAGLELDPELTVDLPDSTDPKSAFDNGFRLTEELLARKKKFTALMAFDDMTALGAMRALEKGGIAIPEQCSVIGFDDLPLAAVSSPPLTTVRQPMEAMGSTAAGIVIEAITATLEHRESGASHQKVAPELVIRESTQARK